MKYQAMLDKLDWNFTTGWNSIDKLDRILSSFKKSLLNMTNTSDIYKEYHSFWVDIADFNIYMCAILVKRQERIYSLNDPCVESGLSVLNERLRGLSFEDASVAGWRFLAEIELSSKNNILEYTKFLLNEGKLKYYLKCLQYSNNVSNSVLFFLHSTFVSDVQLRRDVLQLLVSLKWNIEISDIYNQSLVLEIIQACTLWDDIPSMISLFDLCTDLKLSEHSNKSLAEWKQYLLLHYQPISMILYRKILKRERVSSEDILSELFCFTSWATEKMENKINDYIYFAYAITAFPENYDKYCSCFDSDDSLDVDLRTGFQVEDINEMMSESSLRGLNHLIVEKPFTVLINYNPNKVPDFINRTKHFSLYHISKSLQYKRSQTWVENNYLNDYKAFLLQYAKNHSPEEVLQLYLSSPIKSLVDFSYVIRLLFQPEIGFVDLTKTMEEFTFRGKLVIKSQEDKKIAFRVSISNASSSYLFPLHHSWTTLHMNELQNNYSDGDIVYFKIMSINSKGMIFAHNLSANTPTSKKEKVQNKIESCAIKHFDKIKEGTLPLQGNNQHEDVKLFVVAMICDNEDRILVESALNKDKSIECLPCLPVSNHESSDKTIKRLLKYYIGFRNDVYFQPSGILHLCTDNNKRNIFMIYKVPIQKCLDIQDKLLLKKAMCWRDITTYIENINDPITQKIVDFWGSSWSEQVMNI